MCLNVETDTSSIDEQLSCWSLKDGLIKQSHKPKKRQRGISARLLVPITALFMYHSHCLVKTDGAAEGGTATDHFSPVQPVLQQLHVLAGVLFQSAF